VKIKNVGLFTQISNNLSTQLGIQGYSNYLSQNSRQVRTN